MTPIFYFGCLGDTGHYLFTKIGGYRSDISRQIKTATPWGYNIDAGIFKGQNGTYTAGRVFHTQANGWSVLYLADYSVDSRPGSHSTFLAKGLIDRDTMLAEARAQWPEVFGRARFPKLIL